MLDGILGTLGELIEVPPEYERAMEAALGGRVQDVVVRGWEDAEAAVDFLKRNQAGRATFLPLDTLRPGRAGRRARRRPASSGWRATWSTSTRQIRPAVELALNHTLVVEDLPTARRLLGRGGGATLVTLDGEIVRSVGQRDGRRESKQRDSGLLARARQLRELPDADRPGGGRRRGARAGRSQTCARRRPTARAALDALRARRDELNARAQARLNAEMSKTQLAAERARQTVSWHEERRKGARARGRPSSTAAKRSSEVAIADLDGAESGSARPRSKRRGAG